MRKRTREPPCATTSRRPGDSRRMRWRFWVPGLRTDPESRLGVYATASDESRSGRLAPAPAQTGHSALVGQLAPAIRRGCRENLRPARWMVSKARSRERPPQGSREHGGALRRAAPSPWYGLPRPQTTVVTRRLSDSLVEKEQSRRYRSAAPNPIAPLLHWLASALVEVSHEPLAVPRGPAQASVLLRSDLPA